MEPRDTAGDEQAPWQSYAAVEKLLLLLERADDTEFAAFCSARPAMAEGLRRIYERWSSGRRPPGSPSSARSLIGHLRAQLGTKGDAGESRATGGPDASRPPSSGSRYSVEEEIARGGMGAILRVFDHDLRRVLAMKVALQSGRGAPEGPEPAAEARSLQRFLEEAQVTGQLDHPGVVPVHELGVNADGRLFFTMRLVRGRDLREIFELGRAGRDGWNPTRAVGALLKACETMAYAHSKGVLHRDLKPANLMVGKFGEVYVMDWGLAKVIGREETHDLRPRETSRAASVSVRTDRRAEAEADPDSPVVTMDGTIVGTPAYMPPEQAEGLVERIGPWSDVYSMGAMLYELLTGRMPYSVPGVRLAPLTIMNAVLEGPPPAIHGIDRTAPPELAAICEKAMARAIEQRYATMVEMADDLRSYLEGRVVRAHEVGALAEFRKWVRRNRSMAAAIATIIIVTLGGLAGIAVIEARANKSTGAARDLAASRLAEVERFSDAVLVRELETEAETLWPRRAGKAAAMRSWLDRAQELLARRDQHEESLRRLEEVTRAGLLEPADMRVRWRIATLQDLLGRLRGLDVLIANVQARREFSERIAPRSILDFAGEWDEAVRQVALHPKYGGLRLTPQIGLVPLGADPGSQLLEFWHVETGARPERDPQTRRLQLTEETGMVLVLVPGGTFTMGAEAPSDARPEGSPHVDPQVSGDEGPVHAVTLAPFFLAKHEMTQGQWLRFAGHNPSWHKSGAGGSGGDYTLLGPVEQVSWSDCRTVLDRLGLVLPTEAQWEHAARAGTDTIWWTGNASASLAGAANLVDQDDFSDPAPIGSFRPNAFGLHDVAGNVFEWCRDDYASYDPAERASESAAAADPAAAPPRERVLRGGSFDHPAFFARSAFRYYFTPDVRPFFVGIRPAREIEP